MRRSRQGFTLIELSIVIVIIALIVGAVLVGRDLINAAQMRKVITVHEQLTVAINTFKVKYGYIPGDIPTARAQNFGFESCSNLACGNGDGRINANVTGPYNLPNIMTRETTLFWRHMKSSGLFASSIDLTAPISASDALPDISVTTEADVWRYTPKSIISGSMFLSGRCTPPSCPFKAGLHFGKASTIPTGLMIPSAAVLTPSQAYYVDNKMDDGYPFGGSVTTSCSTGGNPLIEDSSKWIPCQTTDASQTACAYYRLSAPLLFYYNIGGSQANNINCEMTMSISAINP